MLSSMESKQYESLLDIPENMINHIMRLSVATYQRNVRAVSYLIIQTWDEQRIICYDIIKKIIESDSAKNDSAFVASIANNLKIPNNHHMQNNFILSFNYLMNFDQKLIIFTDRFEDLENKYKRYWTINSGINKYHCPGIFSGSSNFKSFPLPSKEELLATKTEKNLHNLIVEIKKYSEEINEHDMTDLCNIYMNSLSASLLENRELEAPLVDRGNPNHCI